MKAPVPCDILILSASYGAGHNHVARAISTELHQNHPELQVEVRDFFALAAPRINRLTQACYIKMVRHFPPGWRLFYELTYSIRPGSPVQRWLNSIGRRRLVKLLRNLNPRVIVCTFPTPAGVLSALCSQGLSLPPVITVITDVAVHNQWLHPYTEAYVVADESMINGLIRKGIPGSRIYPLGIPLRNSFDQNRAKPQQEILASFGLRKDIFTVLVMGGAFGMLGEEADICTALGDLPEDIQVIAVCGHNRLLFERLRNLEQRISNPLHVFGYVENIADLMDVSDVLISKAGGITVYEALAKGLPLLVYKPIPGQEEGNTRFIEKIGAGMSCSSITELTGAVKNLQNNPATREAMQKAALTRAKPAAVKDTANLVLNYALSNTKLPADTLFTAKMA